MGGKYFDSWLVGDRETCDVNANVNARSMRPSTMERDRRQGMKPTRVAVLNI